MSKIYYINIKRKKRNTAGAKAPDDIAEICRRAGYHQIEMPLFPGEKGKVYRKLWLLTVCVFYWCKAMLSIQQGATVIYQHPQYGVRIEEKFIPLMQKLKKCKFVGVIHDLESLRGGIRGIIKENQQTNYIADDILLKHMDCLICHNRFMKNYLISHGYPTEKLVCLNLFDYLVGENKPVIKQHKRDKWHQVVAIAGNLAAGKSQYIYKITASGRNQSLQLNLYGNNYDESRTMVHMSYKGSFQPEELLDHLEGDFGLVWDGPSAKTCAGNTGNYLKYNNPHKTSLYLAAGMPVIVWKKAAIADFVIKNGVGIAVESLYRLDHLLQEITDKDYNEMCANASKIGKKVQDGWYFMTALEKAINIVK